MAWTTPKTWAVGEVLTASDMNAYVSANDTFLYSGKPAAYAYKSTTHSHTVSGAWQNPTFDAETGDTGQSALHDTVTNSDRFTVPSTAWYLMGLATLWDSNTTGDRAVGFDFNNTAGAGLLNAYNIGEALAIAARPSVVTMQRLTAAAIIRAALFQDSGGTRTVTVHMWMIWLGG